MLFTLTLFVIPLIFEIIGMNFNGPMGVKYQYSQKFLPKFLGLPILVWVFWVIFILTGYNLTNAIFTELFKLNYQKLLRSKLDFLILILFDGFIVLTFDIFIDPIAVKFDLWQWYNFKEAIFSVPVGNFIGWYVIVSTTTFLLRLIDRYFNAQINLKFEKLSAFLYLYFILILFVTSLILSSAEHAIFSLIFASLPIQFSMILIWRWLK